MNSGYSTSQMDNFYEALAMGMVKPSGIMNYIQHLFIAERCPSEASVLDICCGRGLFIPVLKTRAPHIADYVGVDISLDNLHEAQQTISKVGGCPFECKLVQGDATKLSALFTRTFDVIIYTSAVEHLDRDAGIQSIHQASKLLSKDGHLYLSTPRTLLETPRRLQYKVHVYEWDREEIEGVLNEAGLQIENSIGLLPPEDEILEPAIKSRFGISSVAWFREMRKFIPAPFLASVSAVCFPVVAKELLYVCKLKGA